MIFSIIPWEAFHRVQQEMARRTSLNRKKQKDVKTELGNYFGKICPYRTAGLRGIRYCLPLHIRMFYGMADENSIANDEMRLEQLKSMVIEMAGKDNIAGEDFIALSKEIAEAKRVIAEKKKTN